MTDTARPITNMRIEAAVDGGPDAMVAKVVEAELPGFWGFLKARHPQFAGYGEPAGPPVGYIHGFQVYEAMAETIPAYVRALRTSQ